MIRPSDRHAVDGIWLGMTADDVRSRLDPHHVDSWDARIDAGDWTITRRSESRADAFTFHEGQLVAVHIELHTRSQLDQLPSFDAIDASVLTRTTLGPITTVDLISRQCPTHRAQAEQMMRAHR